jgi:hypothetical protein
MSRTTFKTTLDKMINLRLVKILGCIILTYITLCLMCMHQDDRRSIMNIMDRDVSAHIHGYPLLACLQTPFKGPNHLTEATHGSLHHVNILKDKNVLNAVLNNRFWVELLEEHNLHVKSYTYDFTVTTFRGKPIAMWRMENDLATFCDNSSCHIDSKLKEVISNVGKLHREKLTDLQTIAWHLSDHGDRVGVVGASAIKVWFNAPQHVTAHARRLFST